MDKIIKTNELKGKLHFTWGVFFCRFPNLLLKNFNLISASATQIIDGATTLREGDIAVSSGTPPRICFARSCLWSKSVDGHVYIAYNLSPEYSMLF